MPAKKKPPEPDHRTCGQCKHWITGPDYEHGSGECFWKPPRVMGDEEGGLHNVRPILPAEEHACGQFTGCH
jgi:hypothetical protein